MNLEFLNRTNIDMKTDITVAFITKEELKKHEYKALLKKSGFEAAQDSTCLLHEKKLLLCGIENGESENLRSSAASAIKALQSTKYKRAKVLVDNKNKIAALVEGFVLGGYTFEEYKSKKKEKTLKTLSFVYTQKDYKEAIDIFSTAVILADATSFTRDLVNRAPDDLYPEVMAKIAKKWQKKIH
jgi:leucyl aminopeptidase